MKTVCVAGNFDPLHIGHVRHIQKAKKLGDKLVVIIHPDNDVIKKKGYCFMPLEQRKAIIEELKSVDEVVVAIDNDITCAKTLRLIKPNIFAKGGSRVLGTLPENEIQICQELGIQIVYGIGEQLASSQELVKRAAGRER